MTSRGNLIKLNGALFTLCVAIVLIVSPLYVFISSRYVESQYARTSFPASERFAPDERARLSRIIVGYLRGKHSLEEMRQMRTDSGEVAMKGREVEHIVDVKQVTDGFFWAEPIALALGLLTGWGLFRWRGPQSVWLGIRRGSLLTLGLMALILLGALLDFGQFFARFHQIFFDSGTWIFYAEDTLIQLYPLTFWIDAVSWLTLSIGAEALLLLGCSSWRLRAQRIEGKSA